MIKYNEQNISVGLCYVILSLIIGECHPFSLVDMYNRFPEKACTFYLTDTKGKLLPIENYYHYKTGDLTHNYNAICKSKNITGDNHTLTSEQLHNIGEIMMSQLGQRCFSKPLANTIQLHQIYFFLKNDSIQSNDIIMYEACNE